MDVRLVAVGGALALFVLAAAPAPRDVRRDVGDHARECGACHGAHEGAPAGDPAADPARCGLLAPGSEAATSRNCLACHSRHAFSGHPYDVDYPRLESGTGARALRSYDEVVRRGLLLPEGQVRCVTCHDRTSPWKFHIKLPPGAKATPAIDFRRPLTYENPGRLPPPRPGDDVGKKPLCITCHALD